MTRVTFFRDSGKALLGFRCEDHAGFADAGEDIVCAAISMITINTVNSVLALTGDRPEIIEDQDKAIISMRFSDKPSEASQLLLRSLLLGLRSIKEDEQTRQFIDIVYQEV